MSVYLTRRGTEETRRYTEEAAIVFRREESSYQSVYMSSNGTCSIMSGSGFLGTDSAAIAGNCGTTGGRTIC